MELQRLTWASWVFVAACAWAGGGEELSTCPCELAPAYNNYPGEGEGNLLWNCRDRLVPEVPTACWDLNPNVTQVRFFLFCVCVFVCVKERLAEG